MENTKNKVFEELTVDKARQYFSYNKETGHLTWRITRGGRSQKGSMAGCLDTKGRLRIRFGGRTYAATHVIWMIVFGKKPDDQIDHINLIRNDDRLENLREATCSQNCMNRRKKGILPKGVSFCGGKYIARITVGRKTNNLGSFLTKELAEIAYQEASVKFHGEFRLKENKL